MGISDPLTLDPTIGLDGGAVATYVDDLAGGGGGSIAPVSAICRSWARTGDRSDLGAERFVRDLYLPVSVSGDLSLELTSVVAELRRGCSEPGGGGGSGGFLPVGAFSHLC